MRDLHSKRPARPETGPRRINQADIARRANVSISTVSRALSGAPGTRPEVRARILEIASSLGYVIEPPAVASTERAVVILPMHPVTGGLHQSFQENFDGVKEEAAEQGMELFPYLLPESEITASRIQGYLNDHGTGSTLLFYSDPTEALCQLIQAEGAMVMVNNSDPMMRFDSILPDNVAGTRIITDHVIAAGHRRIAYVIGNTRLNPRQRLDGFQSAVSGRPELETSVINIGYDREETALEYFRKLFAEEGTPRWTAALCANDLMALGMLQAASEAGLNVPGDFSLVGFDNLGWSQLATPRLTTMDVDRREMGREAVRLLRRRQARPTAPVLSILQAATLLDGNSVAEPPDRAG